MRCFTGCRNSLERARRTRFVPSHLTDPHPRSPHQSYRRSASRESFFSLSCPRSPIMDTMPDDCPGLRPCQCGLSAHTRFERQRIHSVQNGFTASRADSQLPEKRHSFQKRGTASRKKAQLPEKRHSFRKKDLAPRYRAARFTPQQEASSLSAPVASATSPVLSTNVPLSHPADPYWEKLRPISLRLVPGCSALLSKPAN
jgi:hypothetical protein